jgi:hypothetical protein
VDCFLAWQFQISGINISSSDWYEHPEFLQSNECSMLAIPPVHGFCSLPQATTNNRRSSPIRLLSVVIEMKRQHGDEWWLHEPKIASCMLAWMDGWMNGWMERGENLKYCMCVMKP